MKTGMGQLPFTAILCLPYDCPILFVKNSFFIAQMPYLSIHRTRGVLGDNNGLIHFNNSIILLIITTAGQVIMSHL